MAGLVWKAWLVCCLPWTCHGAAPLPITLHHMAWSARDGAPPMVLTITQTTDGWLWLGSTNGLFRFDGVRFERYADAAQPLPSHSISILSSQPDGALWIGYRYGGASVLAGGVLRNYNERDGLPASAAVWGLEPDGLGRMWAATNDGMFYLENGRWQAAGPAAALPRAPFKTLMRDRDGKLWAQGAEGVYRLAARATRFHKAAPERGTGVLFQVPDGSIWSWNALLERLYRLTPPGGGAAPRHWQLSGDVASMLFDRHGDLWIGGDAGVSYHDGAVVRRCGPEHGLSGRLAGALFEDREGNIWAATATGIDRFRSQRIAAVPLPPGAEGNSLAAAPDGGVWVGRYHLPPAAAASYTASPLWPGARFALHNVTTSAYRDPGGVLWIGGYGGLWRKAGASVQHMALPLARGSGAVNSMARGDDGHLWLSLLPGGLYRLDAGGGWQAVDGVTGLPGESPRVMASTPDAGLWLGYPRSRVLHQHAGRWQQYGTAQGLAIGMVAALHLRGGHVWVGGENGLALRQGAAFIAVRGSDGERYEGISGIVELANGDLWLHAANGLFRIPAEEVVRLQASPGHAVRYERLGAPDGLVGTSPVRTPTPSLIQSSDGMLWLSSTAGVFRLDPARRPAFGGPPPPVLIRGLGQSGRLAPPVAGMQLAAGTTVLQFDYTALALSIPERVAFRYRLEGVDQQWQHVGARRSAYYSNLGPGAYRFQVMASNYDGVWPETATTLAFSIAPTLTQSWWFRAGCLLALLVLGWQLYRRRLRNLAARMAERLEARSQERERIARELHDTLLQSVQGLVLHVHAAAVRLPGPEPARAMIETALRQADEVMREGRDRVRDLRREGAPCDLAAALAAAGQRLQPPDAAPLLLSSPGLVRPLHPAVYEEVLAIAVEAIANAYRHARASRIEVRLEYGRSELRVQVSDNGAGMDEEVLAGGGRQGHWGLRGMRERAGRIQARLVLSRQAGGGTTWRLTLPGALAYPAAPRRLRLFRRGNPDAEKQTGR